MEAGTRHGAKHQKSATDHVHSECDGVEKGWAQGPAYSRRVKQEWYTGSGLSHENGWVLLWDTESQVLECHTKMGGFCPEIKNHWIFWTRRRLPTNYCFGEIALAKNPSCWCWHSPVLCAYAYMHLHMSAEYGRQKQGLVHRSRRGLPDRYRVPHRIYLTWGIRLGKWVRTKAMQAAGRHPGWIQGVASETAFSTVLAAVPQLLKF